MMAVTQQIIDHDKIGKKGFPRHYQAFNLEPPMKTVPVLDDQPQLDHAGLTFKELVMIERDRRIDGGFDFKGVRYQTRPQDRENIAGTVQLAERAINAGAQVGDFLWHGGETPFVWIAEDNSLQQMDAQTVVEFGTAAANFKRDLIMRARLLKDMETPPSDYEENEHWS